MLRVDEINYAYIDSDFFQKKVLKFVDAQFWFFGVWLLKFNSISFSTEKEGKLL